MHLFSFANIESFKTTGLSKESFSFSDVCSHFKVKDPLLISRASKRKIDCMGRSFFISNFCAHKFKSSKNYSYAEFDAVEKKVNCMFATSVILELSCSGKFKKFCDLPNKACLDIKKIYASNLTLVRSYTLEKMPPILKCLYK
ncbi:MAG: hypothetical protein CME69_04070 [Halobacteriovorax sp.]|nr:hypothetical protein [Halobacteriovorax sp.]